MAGLCAIAVGRITVAQERRDGTLRDVARLFTDEIRKNERLPHQKTEVVIRIFRGRAGAIRGKRIIGQPVPRPGGGVLILADRRMIQRLKKAAELIEQKNFVDAATLLQIIIDRSEDSFFHPDPRKKTLYRSLKTEAQRLIGGMPNDGLRTYELQHGATARAMLADAFAANNVAAVAEVSRRFFFTKAGREAMYYVGSVHFDRGRPLAAALCFNQLLRQPAIAARWEPALSLKAALGWNRAGMPRKSQEVLANLQETSPRNTVQVGGADVKLFPKDGDSIVWLNRVFGSGGSGWQSVETDWAMLRGNAARNGVMTGDDNRPFAGWQSPVSTVYDVTRFPTDSAETENDRQLRQAVRDAKDVLELRKQVAMPRSQPLLVNGTMYVRTIGSILALNPDDGSRRWETFFDTTIARMLGNNDNAVPGPTNVRALQTLVSQRIWGDSTYGTMSSDGRYLYAIEDLSLAGIVNPPQQQSLRPSRANSLVAYYISGDRRVGQRAWTLGGPAGGDPLLLNPLAGTFFLGSPLPLSGQLYCLAEVNGEVRLLVIDPAHPQTVVWSQPLAGARLPIHQDVSRRLSGTTVSYADGVMVCPTDAGYVIAVDLTQRSLLWGYQYQSSNNVPGRPVPRPRPAPLGQTRWVDSAATIADGKVLLTPRTGNDVVCLNLLDGSLAWKKTKPDGLYLAGVVDGKVLLVGANTVQALSLKDGSAAWKEPVALPTPSGRGFIRSGRLYLPLSSARMAVVDIATGSVIARTNTQGDIIPGNVIAIGDAILSQGIDRVDLFAFPMDEKNVADGTVRP
jgi:outer membrane protein assembly factor BamB